jgi:hypothetical protein
MVPQSFLERELGRKTLKELASINDPGLWGEVLEGRVSEGVRGFLDAAEAVLAVRDAGGFGRGARGRGGFAAGEGVPLAPDPSGAEEDPEITRRVAGGVGGVGDGFCEVGFCAPVKAPHQQGGSPRHGRLAAL